MDHMEIAHAEESDEDTDGGATEPRNLQQRVSRWRERESFPGRWLGNAVRFAVELSTFFAVLSLVGVPLAIALPEATLAPNPRAATPWHVVVPAALTLTGAAWCWSV